MPKLALGLVAIATGVVCCSHPVDFTPLTFVCTSDAECARGTVCQPDKHICVRTRTGCGNGIMETGEECDDGDARSGDGCTPACMLEPGWACGQAGCYRCGDGIIQAGEVCDDGSVGCRGCTNVAFGWTCRSEIGKPGTCTGVQFSEIATGAHHTCGITTEGKAVCSGLDRFSVDDPTPTGRTKPPLDLPPIVHITAGDAHTCAITEANGKIVCWGSNYLGAEGMPDLLGAPPLTGVREISAGTRHTCVIQSSGTAACWGQDDEGDTVPPRSPTFVQIESASFSTCGLLLRPGPIMCWGQPIQDAVNVDCDIQKPEVNGGMYTSFGLGDFHGCGVRFDGAIRCWSFNVNFSERVCPPPGNDYAETVGGHYYSCARRTNGRVVCWGDEKSDACGILKPPAGEFAKLFGGDDHICGIHADGTVECWGCELDFVPER